MEDNYIIHLFFQILDTKHLICKVSLKSNNGVLSRWLVGWLCLTSHRQRGKNNLLSTVV